MRKRFLVLIMAFVLVLGIISPTMAATTSSNAKVQWLINKGWVEGRGEGVGLALDQTITRAEFAKMIVVLTDGQRDAVSKEGNLSAYGDVAKSHWANGYINQVNDKGYFKGYEDGSFKPEANIKYNEVIAVLSRLHPCFVEKDVKGVDWAKQYIEFADAAKILLGMEFREADFVKDALREGTFELVYNSYHSPKECKDIVLDKDVQEAKDLLKKAKDLRADLELIKVIDEKNVEIVEGKIDDAEKLLKNKGLDLKSTEAKELKSELERVSVLFNDYSKVFVTGIKAERVKSMLPVDRIGQAPRQEDVNVYTIDGAGNASILALDADKYTITSPDIYKSGANELLVSYKFRDKTHTSKLSIIVDDYARYIKDKTTEAITFKKGTGTLQSIENEAIKAVRTSVESQLAEIYNNSQASYTVIQKPDLETAGNRATSVLVRVDFLGGSSVEVSVPVNIST